MLAQRLTELGIGLVVERAGGVVENQNLGFPAKARARSTLCFCPPLRLAPLWSAYSPTRFPPLDKLVRLRIDRRFFDAFPVYSAPEIDVFANGVRKSASFWNTIPNFV
jgi:hypothetical protein